VAFFIFLWYNRDETKGFVMRKAMYAVCLMLCTFEVFAASSTIDLSSGPVKKEKYEVLHESAAEPGRRVKSDPNLYYIARSKRAGELYKNFNGCDGDGCAKTSRSFRAELKKTADERKYNLNNPFYQPLADGFASVTDLSYGGNSLDFVMLQDGAAWQNHIGKYSGETVSATEHLSFGITDDVTVIGSARLSKSYLNIHWDTMAAPFNNDRGETKAKLDLWGVGAIWRFMDNSDWIANIMGAYESLVDVASAFVGEAKVGYKNDDTMVYGFGRATYLDWKNNSGYGFGLTNQYGQSEFFYEKENVSSSTYYDLGVGIFAAMNPDWSADAQLLYSYAEWHSQIAGRASVSYQPWKNAAISLYGRIALWDSADGFDKSAVWFKNNVGGWTRNGTAKFDNYSDWTVGAQLTLAF
jgi:hypothetical protein